MNLSQIDFGTVLVNWLRQGTKLGLFAVGVKHINEP
jgi:hypothetical protein